MGTPDYMSPEQARADKADARSDLFTLGIIFYELLTGKLPFQADTLMATLLKRTRAESRTAAGARPNHPAGAQRHRREVPGDQPGTALSDGGRAAAGSGFAFRPAVVGDGECAADVSSPARISARATASKS